MTRMVTSLSALILSIILLVSGNAFLMTLLGIRLSIEAISPDIIGWILVCYSDRKSTRLNSSHYS